MSDDAKYYCSHCKAATRPQLWPAGVGGECHEAELLIHDDNDGLLLLDTEGATLVSVGDGSMRQYRPLTDTEYMDLYAALTSDDDRSPGEKARLRSLDR